MAEQHPDPLFARLRAARAKYYPHLDDEAWFPVRKVLDFGVQVDIGHRRLYLHWQDVEVLSDD